MRLRVTFYLLVIVSAHQGWSNSATSQDDKFSQGSSSIYGYVRSTEDSTQLANAHVSLPGTGIEINTGATCFFQFRDLPVGIYLLEISVPGYGLYTATVRLGEKDFIKVDAFLQSEPTIIDEIKQESPAKPVEFGTYGIEQKYDPHYSVKFSGGVSRWFWNDFSDPDWGLPLPPYPEDMKFKNKHFGWPFGACLEFKYHYRPKNAVSLSIETSKDDGYFEREILESIQIASSSRETSSYVYVNEDVTVSAIHLTRYRNWDYSPYEIYIGSGIGYYHSALTTHHNSDDSNKETLDGVVTKNETSRSWSKGNSTSHGFGLQGVLGVDYYLRNDLSVSAEFKGRWMRQFFYSGSSTRNRNGNLEMNNYGIPGPDFTGPWIQVGLSYHR